MALLNAAHYLAAAGLDVLMIDADLEAPGLTLAHKRGRRKPAQGFIALYEECRGFIESGAEPEKAPHKLAGYLHSLTVKTPPLPGVERPGRLALLPAHPSDTSPDAYLRQLSELSIREVVGKGIAVYVAEVIRARVREEGFDYALIDSRTGWSEAAGFCVLGLADALAVVSGLNEQNLLGTKDFLEFVAGREDEAPKPVLRVLSPVPTAEEELKEKRFRRARELLGGEAAVQIPYHPRIALIEEPFVVTQPDHHVTEQYRKAARAVLGLVGDDPATQLREAARLISEDEVAEALDRLRRACPFTKNEVIQALRLVTTEVLRARGGAPAWGDDAFLLLTRLDPKDNIAFLNWGGLLGKLAQLTAQKDPKAAQGLFHQAFGKYQKATDIKTDYHEAFYNWGNLLGELAQLTAQKDPKTAQDLFHQTLDKYEKTVGIKPDKHEAFNNWGYHIARLAQLTAQKDPKGAKELFHQAFEMYEKAIGIRPDKHEAFDNWGNSLGSLAKLIAQKDSKGAQDLFREAFEKHQKAVGIKPDKHEAFYNWGNDLGSLAQIIAQKNPKGAQELFHQAFKKYQKAVGIKPDFQEAFNNWGTDLTRLAEMVWKDKRKTAERHFRDAEKHLCEALSLAPEEDVYRKNLVITLNLWAAKLEESGDARAAEKKREEAEGVSSTPAPDRKKKKPKKRPAKPRTVKK